MDSTAAPSTASETPDWRTGKYDLHCPMCEYNLFGLSEPRCPECGYRFEWREVLEGKGLHPYLFEHHPEANFKSFWRTWIHGLRPGKFWKLLQPTHTLRPRRLLVYWAIVLAALAAPFFTKVYYSANAEWHKQVQWRARLLRTPNLMAFNVPPPPPPNSPQFQAYVDQIYPAPTAWLIASIAWDELRSFVIPNPDMQFILLTSALWPVLTFFAILLFRASILKSGVTPGHFLRVLIYSADHAIWQNLIIALGLCFCIFELPKRWWWRDQSPEILGWLFVVFYVAFLIRLTFARIKYLRVRQATAMLVISQVILLLLLVDVMLNAHRLFQ
jgi:hypothetical protein